MGEKLRNPGIIGIIGIAENGCPLFKSHTIFQYRFYKDKDIGFGDSSIYIIQNCKYL